MPKQAELVVGRLAYAPARRLSPYRVNAHVHRYLRSRYWQETWAETGCGQEKLAPARGRVELAAKIGTTVKSECLESRLIPLKCGRRDAEAALEGPRGGQYGVGVTVR